MASAPHQPLPPAWPAPPTQHWHLALHRQGQAWWGELVAQPGHAGQRFASLPEVVAYLMRLDRDTPARGLR